MSIEKYCYFLERNGKRILPVVFILVAVSITGIVLLDINTDFSLFAPTDSPYKRGSDLMEEAFGNDSQLLLLVPGKKSPDGIRSILKFCDAVTGIGGVHSALTVFPPEMADADDEQLIGQLAMLEQLSSGPMQPVIEDDEGSWFLIRILLTENAGLRETIRAVKELADSEVPGYSISGEPYLEAEIFNYILRILLTLPPLAIILMLSVFRLRIGSFRATILSLVPAILSSIICLGILSWTIHSVSIMTVLIPIFIIVLGSADGLHVTSHIIDLLSRGESNKDAVVKTLKAVGVPIILTTLTTMAGFLSLTTVNSSAITEMAITASGGILLAGIVTWLILPILLLHQKPLKIREEKESRLAGIFQRLTGAPALIISCLLLLASIPGLLRLQADFSMVDMYKKNTEVRRSIESLGEKTGGAFPLMMILKTENYLDGEIAEEVLALLQNLEDEGVISGGISVYSMIKNFSEYMTGREGYPPNDLFAGRIDAQIRKQNAAQYDEIVAENGWTRIILYSSDLKTSTLKAVCDRADQLRESTSIEIYPAGTVFDMMQMNVTIIPQQLKSLVIALLTVTILTSLFLRNVKAGLLTSVPIMITLCGLYSVMGYSGIDISIITSVMSGLTIGVGIDYAIHYISLHYHFRKSGAERPSEKAIQYVATPVLANALGLSIGFSAMLLSPLQIHTTLSILMWVTMVLSAFLSLSLLPTLTGVSEKKEKI